MYTPLLKESFHLHESGPLCFVKPIEQPYLKINKLKTIAIQKLTIFKSTASNC